MLALQQWVEEKLLMVGKVAKEDNLADMLTKPMSEARMVMLGLASGLRGGPF